MCCECKLKWTYKTVIIAYCIYMYVDSKTITIGAEEVE